MFTESFTVMKDPRIAVSDADLREQFDFLILIRDRVSEANDAVTRIRDIKTQLDGAAKRAEGEAYAEEISGKAKEIKEALTEVENEIYQTRNQSRQDPLNYPILLDNKIAALVGVVTSADARPTDQSYTVFEELSSKADAEIKKLKVILETDLPAFNELVRKADIPAVILKK